MHVAAITSSPADDAAHRSRPSASTPASRAVALLFIALFYGSQPRTSIAQDTPKATALSWLAEHRGELREAARDLWRLAEPAHRETRTAAYLTEALENEGFRVERGVADLPTAFVASYGRGEPVIGIVTLLDALPGLSQHAGVAHRRPVEDANAGHACGHHLIMAADLTAAIALREAMERHAIPGTIHVYGAPAEEIYHGGVYMARAGVFDGDDALLFWHPSSVTTVIARSGLAMDSVRYVFEGLPSDATDAADRGRNALDAARAFLAAVSEERASFSETAVVNAVLLEGGLLPSVVPERATAWLFVHERDRTSVGATRARIDALAQRAAAAVPTELAIQHLSATRDWLINQRLAELLHRRLEAQSASAYSEAERGFSESLREPFVARDRDRGEPMFEGTLPLSFGEEPVPISDDTADASWIAPRGGFLVAAYPAGTPSHTWQWTAAGLSDFALEGAERASRVLVDVSIDLFTKRELLEEVRSEFVSRRPVEGYRTPLPDSAEPFEFLTAPRRLR